MSQLPERYRAAIAPLIDKAREFLEQGEELVAARHDLAQGVLPGFVLTVFRVPIGRASRYHGALHRC